MNIRSVKDDFKHRVCEQIDLQSEGVDRYLVTTPFRFDDGDHFGIVLKRDGNNWILTDEATTFLHLSYKIDEKELEPGSHRGELISNSLTSFSVSNRDGELFVPVSEDRFGDALFSLVQAICKVSDVSFLSRERVRSTFLEDFRNFMRAQVPSDRLTFDWTSGEHDAHAKYPVDAFVNHMATPLVVYALPNDEKVNVATISLLTFEKWRMPFRSMAIFEDQEQIARKTLARFGDVCEKLFSSLDDNKSRIADYLERTIASKS